MTNMKELHEICKGCKMNGKKLTYLDGKNTYIRDCRIKTPVLSSTEQCPCINCLIKGICSHGCEEYLDYMRNDRSRLCTT